MYTLRLEKGCVVNGQMAAQDKHQMITPPQRAGFVGCEGLRTTTVVHDAIISRVVLGTVFFYGTRSDGIAK